MVVKTVFQSDEIEAAYLPGEGDFLLVTFAPMDFKTSEDAFWGRAFAEKLGLPALGFVSRTGTNWYPEADMIAAIKAAKKITAKYKRIVTYGSSMGAYGALKYSRRLKATACAAFGPQFSIDPDDIDAIIYTRFYRKDVHVAMAIKEKDVCDNAYLFYDPINAFDRNNASAITAKAPQTHLIPLPYAGHECIKVFAGSQAAQELFQNCLDGNTAALGLQARTLRAHSSARYAGLAQALLPRRPDLAAKVIRATPGRLDRKQRSSFFGTAATIAFQKDDLKTAEKNIRKALEIKPGRPTYLRLLASIHERRSRFSEAVETYKEALSIDPTDTKSYFALANLYQEASPDLALEAIEAALNLAPREPKYIQMRQRIVGELN